MKAERRTAAEDCTVRVEAAPKGAWCGIIERHIRAREKAAMGRVIEAAIQRMGEREWRWERRDFDAMLGKIDRLLDSDEP